MPLAENELYQYVLNHPFRSAIKTYRIPACRVRHFEQLRRMPAGLLAMGDTVCGLNPVRGQGTGARGLAAACQTGFYARMLHAVCSTQLLVL